MRRAVAAALALFAAAGAAAADPPAKAAFGAARAPSAGPPQAIGAYAGGCLAGGVAIPAEGPGWRTMRPSRDRAWGHPAAAAFVARLGAAAQARGWRGVLIGDVAQPRGGPMRSGHRSHQTGLDVDVWLTRPPTAPLTAVQREVMGATRMVAADRRRVAAAWTDDHRALVRAAAADAATARVFVNAALKADLCRWAGADDRAWLRRVRPWWGHDHHMHVRLGCPDASPLCVAQDPPPPGDGCDETLAWWFTDEALNPAPAAPEARPRPRREARVSDLPPACAALVNP